jgi:hypothetical protein
MGKAARKRAEELDWRVIGQLHHEVYRSVRASKAKAVINRGA